LAGFIVVTICQWINLSKSDMAGFGKTVVAVAVIAKGLLPVVRAGILGHLADSVKRIVVVNTLNNIRASDRRGLPITKGVTLDFNNQDFVATSNEFFMRSVVESSEIKANPRKLIIPSRKFRLLIGAVV
jgi:hypothetical protein